MLDLDKLKHVKDAVFADDHSTENSVVAKEETNVNLPALESPLRGDLSPMSVSMMNDSLINLS